MYPASWTQRRIAFPAAEPMEIPTASRRAPEDGGFTIIENRQPQFLFERGRW